MRVPSSFCVALAFAVPFGTGAFLAGGASLQARVPSVGETVYYDGGDAKGEWVVARRVRSVTGVVLELRNGEDVAFADPAQVRTGNWGFGF